MSNYSLFSLLICILTGTAACVGPQMKDRRQVTVQSAGVLTFGPDNTLFIGDSRTATIHAFQTETGQAPAKSRSYNIVNIQGKVARFLGVPPHQIRLTDLAVHPVSQEAYIAATVGHGERTSLSVLRVSHDGMLREFNLSVAKHTKITLKNPANTDVKFWGRVSARSLSITDIDYYKGELIVAGLSNAEFASTVYRIPYPFEGTISVSRIEMYHTVHNQTETRAPIRTQIITELNGEPHLVAVYTCAPVVAVPLAALTDGAKVKAKTIAELGHGSTPVDMLSFQAQNEKGEAMDMVMILNKERGATLTPLSAIGQASARAGMTKPNLGPAGVSLQPVPLAGVFNIENQDAQYLLGLRRDMETGALDLLSFPKGWYFRLSDFVSEYNFSSYAYPADGSQKFFEQVQFGMKTMEGYDPAMNDGGSYKGM